MGFDSNGRWFCDTCGPNSSCGDPNGPPAMSIHGRFQKMMARMKWNREQEQARKIKEDCSCERARVNGLRPGAPKGSHVWGCNG